MMFKKILAFILALLLAASVNAQVGMSSVATPTGGYSFTRISATAQTTTLKTGYGTLHSVVINSPGGTPASVTLYDNTAASGTVIAVIAAAVAETQGTYQYDIAFTTGLTVVVSATTTAADVTFTWK